MRINYLDTLKGVAIILMLIGHCYQWNFQDFDAVFYNGKRSDIFLWHLIYSFHMPLFFFISGYFLPRESFRFIDLKNVLWRRTYTLLIPYICSGTLMSFLLGNWGGYIDLWFLKSLYELTLVCLLYEYIRYRFGLELLCDVLFFSVLYILLKLAYQTTENTLLDGMLNFEGILGKFYFGFVFGIFCRRYRKLERLLDTNHAYTVCLIYFFLLSSAFFLYIQDNSILWSLLSKLTPLSAIVCMVYLTKHTICQKKKSTQLLNYIGVHSLEIYIIHYLFNFRCYSISEYAMKMIQSDNVREVIWGHTFMFLTSVMISAVLIVLCLFITNIIRTSDFLSVVLLGRKNNKVA